MPELPGGRLGVTYSRTDHYVTGGGTVRILHVNKFLYRRGGAEGYLLDVAALQRAAGHEVEFFAMQHPDNEAPQRLQACFPAHVELDPPPGGVASLRAAARMVWSPASERGLREALAQFQPDVVHCHNIYHQLSPSILRPVRAGGYACVMTLHDYKIACPNYQMLDHGQLCDACVGGGTWHAATRRCKDGSLVGSTVLAIESGVHRLGHAYDPVHRFICPSAFMAGVMRRQGIAGQRLVIVNNFTKVSPMPRHRELGRDVVFAGRLSPEKGVDTLLHAVGMAPSALLLHVAGDGPSRRELERLADQVAPGRVKFYGRLSAEALSVLVSGSLATVAPSRWYENQPMTILEAFAVGVPAVVTDLGGMPDLVTTGVHGLVVPPNDPAALAAAITRLHEDPAGARAMGLAGRRRIETQFGGETHLARLEEVYASALAAAAVRGRHSV